MQTSDIMPPFTLTITNRDILLSNHNRCRESLAITSKPTIPSPISNDIVCCPCMNGVDVCPCFPSPNGYSFRTSSNMCIVSVASLWSIDHCRAKFHMSFPISSIYFNAVGKHSCASHIIKPPTIDPMDIVLLFSVWWMRSTILGFKCTNNHGLFLLRLCRMLFVMCTK